MESEVSAAFDSGEAEDILSRAFKLNVTREDICTLQPLGWLNDRVWHPALPAQGNPLSLGSGVFQELHCRAQK